MDEKTLKQEAEKVVDKVKALVKEGNVSRVRLKRNGETLVNIPVSAGVIGAAIGLYAAPFAVLAAGLVAFGMDCTIEIEKKDGSVVKFKDDPVDEVVDEVEEATVVDSEVVEEAPAEEE